MILHVDKENKRISLGLKQLQRDPWEDVTRKYPVGANVKGKVVRLTEFGAFVELEAGVDGCSTSRRCRAGRWPRPRTSCSSGTS